MEDPCFFPRLNEHFDENTTGPALEDARSGGTVVQDKSSGSRHSGVCRALGGPLPDSLVVEEPPRCHKIITITSYRLGFRITSPIRWSLSSGKPLACSPPTRAWPRVCRAAVWPVVTVSNCLSKERVHLPFEFSIFYHQASHVPPSPPTLLT